MAEPVVRAQALTNRYGGYTAVDAIDLEIPAGVCFGILGPNGAGKTTTIRMISCRFPPDEGTLLVLGRDVTAEPSEIKARLGLVPQEDNLDESLTALQNLEIYGRYFGMDGAAARRRAEELLDFMELSAKRDAPARELSGGMKRRTVIARALINQPELVVLDEPTTGLDPQARVLLWDRIRELKAQGVSLLLTTHYMDEAERLCDELLIMHEGRVLDRGAPAEVVEPHAGRWVAEAAGPAAAPAAAWHARLAALGRLHLYGQDHQAPLQTVKELALEPYAIRPANLEDVFLIRTGRGIIE